MPQRTLWLCWNNWHILVLIKWDHLAISKWQESDVLLGQPTFVLWSGNPQQDRALLSSSLTQQQLLRGSSMWPSTCWTVCPTTHSDRIFTTYLPQHNFDSMSVFLFTRRWLTVLLPPQAHNRPKPTSHLHFLATKHPFHLIWDAPLLSQSVMCCCYHWPHYVGMQSFLLLKGFNYSKTPSSHFLMHTNHMRFSFLLFS